LGIKMRTPAGDVVKCSKKTLILLNLFSKSAEI
jgi:hypothetical protein